MVKRYAIGDVLEIKHGFAFSGEHIVTSDNGVVLVTPGNFRIGGGFQENKCKFYSGDYPAEYVLPAGTHIVTMTDLSKEIDTLGYSAIVPASERTYLHNQRIGRIVYKDNCIYPLYMHYLMRTRDYQRFVANSSSGATVHHTSPDKICKYEFTAPSRARQEEIADFLHAYDALIENNRRQIKLLEEAAQRLYKEWFVDLRFPGHEHTPIVDGVPQGWHRGRISDISPFTRGKTITKGQTCKGNVPVIAGGLAPAYYHNRANARPPVVTISASGANAGYVSLYQEPVWASDCSYVDANNAENIYLLYQACLSMKAAINNLRKGAAQPHVYASEVNALQILVGDRSIQRKYEAQVSPLFEKRALLTHQIILLAEARDRLLPKLMSGEIEVQELP